MSWFVSMFTNTSVLCYSARKFVNVYLQSHYVASQNIASIFGTNLCTIHCKNDATCICVLFWTPVRWVKEGSKKGRAVLMNCFNLINRIKRILIICRKYSNWKWKLCNFPSWKYTILPMAHNMLALPRSSVSSSEMLKKYLCICCI
jgi:hypothetical protein